MNFDELDERPPLLRTCNTRACYGRGRVPAAHAQMTSPSCDTEQMALCSPFLLGAP